MECGEQFDPVAEHEPWVGVERDHSGNEPALDDGLEHPLMAAMDAVEDAYSDGSLPRVELRGIVGDLHGSTVPSTATSSPSHIARTGRSIRR